MELVITLIGFIAMGAACTLLERTGQRMQLSHGGAATAG